MLPLRDYFTFETNSSSKNAHCKTLALAPQQGFQSIKFNEAFKEQRAKQHFVALKPFKREVIQPVNVIPLSLVCYSVFS